LPDPERYRHRAPNDLLFVVKNAFGLRDWLSVACVGVGS
jgi:hypothetical protein